MDMGRNSKFKDGIRIAAAVYLIYLAVEIIQDGLIGGQMQGKMRIVGIIAVIGFIAFGVVVSIWSVKDLMKMDEEKVLQGGVVRTARRIMDGFVYIR